MWLHEIILTNMYYYVWCFFLLAGKYLVFFFYPLDFTFVCPTEILAFNDRIAEFREIGAEVTRENKFDTTLS